MAHPFPSPAPAQRPGAPLPAWLRALLPAQLALLAAAPVNATAAEGWGGSAALTRPYVFHGLMPRGDAASLQLDLHRRWASGGYAGAWLSSGPDRRGSYGRHEINLYAGLGLQLGERWGLSLRGVHYHYPESRLGRRYDYDEVAATATFDDWLAFSVSASPNTTLFSTSRGLAENRRMRTFEVSLRHALWGPVAGLAGVGHYDTDALFGSAYRAWHLGLALRQGPLELTLSRLGSDGRARQLFRSAAADGRWALSAAGSF